MSRARLDVLGRGCVSVINGNCVYLNDLGVDERFSSLRV